jgi:hypothetical protein
MDLTQIKDRATVNYIWLRVVLDAIQQMREKQKVNKKELTESIASGRLSKETADYAKQQFLTYDANFEEMTNSLESTAIAIQKQMESVKLINLALQKLQSLGGGVPSEGVSGVARVDDQLSALLAPIAEAVRAAKAQTE